MMLLTLFLGLIFLCISYPICNTCYRKLKEISLHLYTMLLGGSGGGVCVCVCVCVCGGGGGGGELLAWLDVGYLILV